MVSKVGISARSIVVALALWFVALPASAFTISLTVSGTTYNVLFTEGSFDAVNGDPATPLTTTPWFGDEWLATDLSNELRLADAGGPVVPDPGAFYLFSYLSPSTNLFGRSYNGPSVPSAPGVVPGGVSGLFLSTTSSDFGGRSLYFASVAPTPVPEIDGNAMAKALFILFTLYVWIQVRRNRRAQG